MEATEGGGCGAVGALAHSLDTRYGHVGHGESYALVTPPVLRFNLEETPSGQARLACELGASAAGSPDVDAAPLAAGALAELFARLGMPSRLRDVDIPPEGVELLAADAVEDFGLHRNPRPIHSAADLVPLLREMY